jgi:hypothetical protein
MKKVLIAGGLCGITMLVAAQSIEESCLKARIPVRVDIKNLWESACTGDGYDVIIEMFPYFENVKCPLFSGKPFILRQGSDALVNNIVACAGGTGGRNWPHIWITLPPRPSLPRCGRR